MRTTGAVLFEVGGEYQVVDLEVADPGPGEVLVEMAYAGLCHSDEHLRHNPGGSFPLVGGHEGSAVVLAVGPGVTRVAPGDSVVTSFLPACGHCRYCATGRSSICDAGATIATGQLPTGTFPFRLDDGRELGGFCMVGAFARHSVLSEFSCVRIGSGVPLDTAALLACSVPTGWGSAVYAGGVRPGDTVVVVGLGGVGVNAVQGAVHAGALHVVGVDPVGMKRSFAESVGATHTVADARAAAGLARELSRGTGADVVVVTVGKMSGEVMAEATRCVGKGGALVLTALADRPADGVGTLNGQLTTVFEHRIQGALFGNCNPFTDIPRLLRMHEEGRLELDRLITRRYALDELTQGYRDQAAGETVRGLLVHAS